MRGYLDQNDIELSIYIFTAVVMLTLYALIEWCPHDEPDQVAQSVLHILDKENTRRVWHLVLY